MLSPLGALAEAQPSTASQGQVTVSGTGIVNLKPDTATITLGVSETAKGAVQAQTTVNKKIASVKKALIKAGAKEAEISVSELSVWGNYDYSGATQELTGYTASHTLNIKTTDMDLVGPLVDAALGAGSNQLQGVFFSLKNDDEAYAQALKLAVEKAREKADVLATAAGVTLGALKSLNETGDYNYGPYISAKYAAADEGQGGGAPTQVDTGFVTVSATVTVVYGLEG
jgi:uncharacterized protein YggE